MTFDLYSTTAAPAPAKPTATTTLEALAAAEWQQIDDGEWQLEWRDHTDYGEGDEEGNWSCRLFYDDGEWIYDFEHDFRGGEQIGNGTGVSSIDDVEKAKMEARRRLESWIDRWTQSAEENLWRAEKEAEEEGDE